MADFFADAGAWFEQAGKDIGEALQDGAEALDNAVDDFVWGDAAQGLIDVFYPNNPDPNWVVDQIENNTGQQPTPDQVIDQIEGTIGQQPTPDYVIGGPDFNEPVPGLPSPVFGPDFNEPAPELPSPIDGPDFNEPAPGLPSPIDSMNDSVLELVFEGAEVQMF